MGKLADAAKDNSNWLLIDKGSFAIVRYDGFELIPARKDPTKRIAQYKVSENGKIKYWENGNGKIMRFLDEVSFGTFIRIVRAAWVDNDGKEDVSKSSYFVEELKQEDGAYVSTGRNSTMSKKEAEKGWDD